jgi:N utilization substance protein A
MSKALIAGINQVATDKGLDREVIFEAIEAALVSAYKRNYGSVANVSAEVDRNTGDMRVFAEREVVEDVMNVRTEIALDDARAVVPDTELGDVIKVETNPDDFGRIAAQTAKQVILQRIREAERDTVFENFAHRVGETLTAQVRSVDTTSGAVTLLVDDKHEVLMMKEDQIPVEKLRRGDYLKVYVVDVHKSTRGPVIKLSRTHRNLLRRLMEQEIPEVRDGLVEIKAIAREPGARSKAAVIATVPNVDPVGSCVGQRGLRIQNIVNELSGEKIDVIEWNPDSANYISNALSPARVSNVLLDEKSSIKTATVIVPDKQLSLAIGKEGQNARLAAKLTGWRIDIKSETEATAEGLDRIIAERAAQRLGKSEDLLAKAERLLKGGEGTADDRFWQAAQALGARGPLTQEMAEPFDTEAEATPARKPAAKPKGPKEAVPGAVDLPDELEEGLPGGLPAELPTLEDLAPATPSERPGSFEDAFRRGLEAVQGMPEPALPSEAPFSEEEEAPKAVEPEAPAKPAEKPEAAPLPQVITADMLRARMAQRKQATEIEVPEELLAGYKEEPPAWADTEDEEIAPAKGKVKGKAKKGAPQPKPADKKGKKKWHPATPDDAEEVY